MIELDSQDFDGWATKGDAQYHLGNFDLALTFYKKAIQINNTRCFILAKLWSYFQKPW